MFIRMSVGKWQRPRAANRWYAVISLRSIPAFVGKNLELVDELALLTC